MNDSDQAWADALAAIHPIFQTHCEEYHVPGCAFGVVAGGRLVTAGGIGTVEPGRAVPPQPDTVYKIASMTKSFGALAILLLRDEGKLALDTPAAEYVPELRRLRYPTRDGRPITLRQLLTMSAGWPEDNPWGDRQLWRSDAELLEVLGAGVSFANAPAVTFEYSNLGYMVLGRVLTAASGEPSLDFITRRILQPLGMRDTTWNVEDVDAERLAQGYHWLDGRWVAEPMLRSGGDVAVFGGLYSTVADLARWVSLQLSAWPPRDEEDEGPVRRATLREMQQPWRMYAPSAVPPELGQPVRWAAGGYGYGLTVNYEGDLCIAGHSGGLPGFGSHMCWLPDYDLGMVALGNVRYATMRKAATAALQALVRRGHARRRPVQPQPALESARQEVDRLLDAWDDDVADRLFADNFFLDDSRAWWQGELARLRAEHGPWQAGEPLAAENGLRGSWTLPGERGSVRAFLTLTPTVPPRVQELVLQSVLPPGAGLRRALERLAAQIARPTRAGAARLFVSDGNLPPDQHTFYDKLHLLSALCGTCTLGTILGGDGSTTVRLLLEGRKAGVEAQLTYDAALRKFTAATFRQVR